MTNQNALSHKNFIRLLERTERFVKDDQIATDQGKARFKSMVKLLKGFYDDFEKEQLKKGLTDATSELYSYFKKIQYFNDLVDIEKLQSPIERGLSDSRLPDSSGDTNKSILRGVEIVAKQRAINDVKKELFSGGEVQEISYGEREQEDLTEEMVKMVQKLKENAESLGEVARDDVDRILETTQVMTSEQTRLKKLNEQLKVLGKRYGNMICLQICLTIMVVIVFIFTYLFMKVFPKKKPIAVTTNTWAGFYDSVSELSDDL